MISDVDMSLFFNGSVLTFVPTCVLTYNPTSVPGKIAQGAPHRKRNRCKSKGSTHPSHTQKAAEKRAEAAGILT